MKLKKRSLDLESGRNMEQYLYQKDREEYISQFEDVDDVEEWGWCCDSEDVL